MDAGISCHAHAACFLKFGQKCTHVICWRSILCDWQCLWSFFLPKDADTDADTDPVAGMMHFYSPLLLPSWVSAERYSKPSGNGTSHVISSDKTVAKTKTRTKGGINRTMVFDHLSGIILRISAAPVVRWICIEMQFCKYPNIIIDRFSVFWLWKISVIFRWR